MFRKAISIILIACFLFQINCATTTKTMPVESYDYDKLTKEKTIFVTTKKEEEYELINFEITDTDIKGLSIVRRPYSRDIIKKEKFEIKLEDIEFILVKKTEVTAGNVVQDILIGVAVLIGVVAALSAIFPPHMRD